MDWVIDGIQFFLIFVIMYRLFVLDKALDYALEIMTKVISSPNKR